DDAEERTVIDADRAVLRLPPMRAQNVGMFGAADVEEALADFRGTYWQTPPAVSARKIAGTRAYVLARRHERVELKPVEVTVRELELLSYASGLAGMRVVCSAGFYVPGAVRISKPCAGPAPGGSGWTAPSRSMRSSPSRPAPSSGCFRCTRFWRTCPPSR
ncbi:MAG: hypothetical protein DMF86_25675, partial [Acidobacteria bacterium]